jgi:hypothetical protein
MPDSLTGRADARQFREASLTQRCVIEPALVNMDPGTTDPVSSLGLMYSIRLAPDAAMLTG